MKPVLPAERPATDLVPIETLDADIRNLCVCINAATWELLVKIREFDERVGWAKWGSGSCAEWPTKPTKQTSSRLRCAIRQVT